jgi:hypothetical protein
MQLMLCSGGKAPQPGAAPILQSASVQLMTTPSIHAASETVGGDEAQQLLRPFALGSKSPTEPHAPFFGVPRRELSRYVSVNTYPGQRYVPRMS